MSDNSKRKDAEMAAYMKAFPGSFPSSADRPWNGVGADVRKRAGKVPASKGGAHWERGMLGGIAAARLGYGSPLVPDEFVTG